ncbi:MAG TPA: hypothetical protein VMU81_13995 [Acetobacteraceae bacterium]|nr:hypothetical protein [Acetobacteraceae bacterium]
MRIHPLLSAAAMAACLAVPARADVTVYYHAGGWDAFDGQDDHGQAFCGIGSRNPVDGRTFSVRFLIGGNGVNFIASKPGWNIPDHTDIPVVVQVGLERPWTEQASGGGQSVQWTLDRGPFQSFDAQFRHASSMTLTFPSGNEPAWIISLSGSTAISNAMGRCVTSMTQRAGAPPPGPAAAGPQSATQPFGAQAGPQPSAAPAPVQTEPTQPNQATQPNPPAQRGQPEQSGQPTQPNAPANPPR